MFFFHNNNLERRYYSLLKLFFFIQIVEEYKYIKIFNFFDDFVKLIYVDFGLLILNFLRLFCFK